MEYYSNSFNAEIGDRVEFEYDGKMFAGTILEHTPRYDSYIVGFDEKYGGFDAVFLWACSIKNKINDRTIIEDKKDTSII